MFPEKNPGNCSSWLGQYHTLCSTDNDGDTGVCTLEHLATSGDLATCRQCADPGEWRCDDGWCINSTMVRNGVPDCWDGSDEDWSMRVGWTILLLYTMTIVSTGLAISYLCRSLKKRNPSSLFHCNECKYAQDQTDFSHDLHYTAISLISKRPKYSHKRDSSRCSIITKEEDDLIPNEDIPSDLICLLENRSTNWDVKRSSRLMAQLLGGRESTTALKSDILSVAKSQYVLVHNDSILYHHLYMYFANRCSSVRELGKVTKYLFR